MFFYVFFFLFKTYLISFPFITKESKFKFYYHILEFYVQRYYHLRDHIPNHFASIMKPLHESTLAYFQPGLSVLKWHSVNVDGFLYKVSC